MDKEEWDALSEDEKDEMGAMLDFETAEDRRKNPVPEESTLKTARDWWRGYEATAEEGK